jgi:hypothetical protein
MGWGGETVSSTVYNSSWTVMDWIGCEQVTQVSSKTLDFNKTKHGCSFETNSSGPELERFGF